MELKSDMQREARNLFLNSTLHRKEIALLLGIDRKTLYTWIKNGNWIGLKHINTLGPSSLVQQYYEQLHAINKVIMQRGERPYPTKEESGIIKGIISCIKAMGNSRPVSEAIKHFTSVTDNLYWKDLKLAQGVMPYMNQHVHQLVKDAKLDENTEYLKAVHAFERDYEETMKEEMFTQDTPHGEMGELGTQEPKTAPVAELAIKMEAAPSPHNSKNVVAVDGKNEPVKVGASPVKKIFSQTLRKAG